MPDLPVHSSVGPNFRCAPQTWPPTSGLISVQEYKGKDNQVIQFEFDTGQELEEWAEAIVAAISRLSVIGLTQTDLTAEM